VTKTRCWQVQEQHVNVRLLLPLWRVGRRRWRGRGSIRRIQVALSEIVVDHVYPATGGDKQGELSIHGDSC
jgi:hypothetical protein